MVAVMLLLIAGGIGLAQAVSDPHQVTLRWLRLGGIIALSLIAVAGTIVVITRSDMWQVQGLLMLIVAITIVGQLIAVQLAQRRWQRAWAIISFLLISCVAGWIIASTMGSEKIMGMTYDGGLLDQVHLLVQVRSPLVSYATMSMLPSSGLAGGYLMAMLLGHAYLTAGAEMTQKPFLRLVKVLAGLMVLRLVASVVFGLWPYQSLEISRNAQMWNTMMITARYCVGLVVPGVFTYMIWDCVRRRSNQSATGILYVATVLVMIGEGIALGLIGETGVVF